MKRDNQSFANRRAEIDDKIVALQRQRADLSLEMTREWQKSIDSTPEEGCSKDSEQPD